MKNLWSILLFSIMCVCANAQSTITNLPQGTYSTGIEEIPVWQGGTTKKLTTGQINSTVFNVKAYPYLAYGNNTNDDTAAINAAIADATAGGKVNNIVYFPCGIYKITSTITLTAAVTLKGSSVQCSEINATQTGTALAGAALVFNPGQLNVLSPQLQDIWINGPYAGDGSYCNNSIGVVLGGSSGASGWRAQNAQISHFCTGLVISANSYIQSWDGGAITANYQNVVFPQIFMTANGTWSASGSPVTITMKTNMPSWIISGLLAYNQTGGCQIGTITSGANSKSLVVSSAGCASSGSTDLIKIVPSNSGQPGMSFHNVLIGYSGCGLNNKIAVTANGSWAVNGTSITTSATVPSSLTTGMSIWDATAGSFIGWIQDASTTNITLMKGAMYASSGASDSLRIVAPTVFAGGGEFSFEGPSFEDSCLLIPQGAGATIKMRNTHFEVPDGTVVTPLAAVLDGTSILDLGDSVSTELSGSGNLSAFVAYDGLIVSEGMSAYGSGTHTAPLFDVRGNGNVALSGNPMAVGYNGLISNGGGTINYGTHAVVTGTNDYVSDVALDPIGGLNIGKVMYGGRTYKVSGEIYFSACGAGGVNFDMGASSNLTSYSGVATISYTGATASLSGVQTTPTTAIGAATANCVKISYSGIAVCPNNWTNCVIAPRASQSSSNAAHTTISGGWQTVDGF